MSRNKLYGRSPSIISRDGMNEKQTEKTPNWISEFASELEKKAVHSKDQDDSLYNQISQILGKKSKYSTVEEAVLDMQKRSGLYEYVNKIKAASAENDLEILTKYPNINNLIDNYIHDNHGEVVIPALLEKIKLLVPGTKDSDFNDNFAKFINDKVIEFKKTRPSLNNNNPNIGKEDTSYSDVEDHSTDVFKGCNPVSKL